MNSLLNRPDPTSEFMTPEGCSILESWNDSRDADVSIARATVAPGVTTQLHRLRDVVERYIILEGAGIVRLGNSIKERVSPGDVVIIPAGTPQQISNSGESNLVFYCICSPRFTPACYEIVGSE